MTETTQRVKSFLAGARARSMAAAAAILGAVVIGLNLGMNANEAADGATVAAQDAWTSRVMEGLRALADNDEEAFARAVARDKPGGNGFEAHVNERLEWLEKRRDDHALALAAQDHRIAVLETRGDLADNDRARLARVVSAQALSIEALELWAAELGNRVRALEVTTYGAARPENGKPRA